jgi:hypothetical protein
MAGHPDRGRRRRPGGEPATGVVGPGEAIVHPAIGPCVETVLGPVEIPVVAEPPPAGARDVAAGLDRPGHRPGHGREP